MRFVRYWNLTFLAIKIWWMQTVSLHTFVHAENKKPGCSTAVIKWDYPAYESSSFPLKMDLNDLNILRAYLQLGLLSNLGLCISWQLSSMEIGQQWKSLGCGAFLGNEAQIPSVLACPDLVKSMNSNSNNHVGLLSFLNWGWYVSRDMVHNMVIIIDGFQPNSFVIPHWKETCTNRVDPFFLLLIVVQE